MKKTKIRTNNRPVIISKADIAKAIRDVFSTHCFVQNAEKSKEFRGSAIEYWERATGINIDHWKCPHCNKNYKRQDLDGAHVVLWGQQGGPQWITPVCKQFNEKKDYQTPFLVHKNCLVEAP